MVKRHPILFSFLVLFVILVFLFGVVIFVVSVSSGNTASFLSGGSVAVVKIEGPIMDSTNIMEDLVDLKKNDAVKAVVVRIDSPGGGVGASQEIYQELLKLKEKKKVVVSMGAVAASGGYYIASAADKIIALPGTVTGSIGVIMESFGLQDLLKFAKVENRVLKTGEFKDAGNPFREMTDKEKAYLQNLIDDMYMQFKGAISLGRNITLAEVEDLAQGKVYTGEQALKVKLVDQLGTLYDAIDEAKKMANLPEDARVQWPREDRFPWNKIDSMVQSLDLNGSLVQRFKIPSWMYVLN